MTCMCSVQSWAFGVSGFAVKIIKLLLGQNHKK